MNMDSLSSVRRALWFYRKDFHARRVVVDVKAGKQFLQATVQLSLGAGAATGPCIRHWETSSL